MHWDSLVLSVLVGTAFAAIAIYQLKTGRIGMKSGTSYGRHEQPFMFWLWIAICTVAAASCYIDAYKMVAEALQQPG